MTKDDILEIIKRHEKNFHRLPTVEEIQASSLISKEIRKLVSELVKDGYIKRGAIRGQKR